MPNLEREIDIRNFLQKGETSKVQFKLTINSPKQLAEEMVAFSNALGGDLLIGVSDTGDVKGINSDDLRKFNQWIANAATENIKPPVIPLTDVVNIDGKNVLVITVREGINKPYCTSDGIYYTKSGSDKRIVSQEELQRLFQSSNKIYADESLIPKSSIEDIDMELFTSFVQKKFNMALNDLGLPLKKILQNLNMVGDGTLTLAGLLLFGKAPQQFKPVFNIKAVYFRGNEISGTEFVDNENIEGNLKALFDQAMRFIIRNLRKVQPKGQGFNALPILEIPQETLEELLVNALVHRDYYLNASIKIFMFDNRIELISPGKLPNSLKIENIKSGQSILRNPVLISNAQYLLPYKGLGSGIPRALSFYKDIEFCNDTDKDQFKVTLLRRSLIFPQ